MVSDAAEDFGQQWRKSSRSYGSGECVEVAVPADKRIAVRDSKNVQGAVLTFSSVQWNAFIASVRTGRFAYRTRRQKPNAGTGSARSPVLRPGVAMDTACPQTVGHAVVGIARLVSVYGWSSISSLGYG
jgi:hypothetical protein